MRSDNTWSPVVLCLNCFCHLLMTEADQRRPVEGPRCDTKNWLRYFVHPSFPPLILQGESKTPKFSLNIRPQSHLKRCGFETVQHIGNPKHWPEVKRPWSVFVLTHFVSPSLIFTMGKIVCNLGWNRLWGPLLSKWSNASKL